MLLIKNAAEFFTFFISAESFGVKKSDRLLRMTIHGEVCHNFTYHTGKLKSVAAKTGSNNNIFITGNKIQNEIFIRGVGVHASLHYMS